MRTRNIVRTTVKPRPHSNNVETALSNAISRTILSTKLNVASTLLLPFLATISNEISSVRRSLNKLNMINLFRLCRSNETSFDIVAKTATMSKQHSTLSKERNFTINSFDIVAVFGNKVECCYDKVKFFLDNVAGVDRALRTESRRSCGEVPGRRFRCHWEWSFCRAVIDEAAT